MTDDPNFGRFIADLAEIGFGLLGTSPPGDPGKEMREAYEDAYTALIAAAEAVSKIETLVLASQRNDG